MTHSTIPVDETRSFPTGPEAECFGVPEGTLVTLHYSGEVKHTEFVSGPNAGRVHEVGQLSFTLTVPSTSTTGSGRDSFNFKAEGGRFVASDRVHVVGTLPDGTAFKATFHSHIAVQDGEVKVDITKVNCVKP